MSKQLKDTQREAEEAVEQIKKMEYFQELKSRDVGSIELIGTAVSRRNLRC